MGTAQSPSLNEAYFGGPFWKNYETYLENSPLMQVEKIKTPTLIHHGLRGSIVVPDQATELFHALKLRNVPVRMGIDWEKGHGLFGKAAIFGSEESLAWLNTYVHAK